MDSFMQITGCLKDTLNYIQIENFLGSDPLNHYCRLHAARNTRHRIWLLEADTERLAQMENTIDPTVSILRLKTVFALFLARI